MKRAHSQPMQSTAAAATRALSGPKRGRTRLVHRHELADPQRHPHSPPTHPGPPCRPSRPCRLWLRPLRPSARVLIYLRATYKVHSQSVHGRAQGWGGGSRHQDAYHWPPKRPPGQRNAADRSPGVREPGRRLSARHMVLHPRSVSHESTECPTRGTTRSAQVSVSVVASSAVMLGHRPSPLYGSSRRADMCHLFPSGLLSTPSGARCMVHYSGP